MDLVITGAAGFVGRHVVTEALKRSHRVRAFVRPGLRSVVCGDEEGSPVRIVKIELREGAGLLDELRGADAVVHLAATNSGTPEETIAGTLHATRALLDAMASTNITRLIAISSFSVFDYVRLAEGDTVDEATPVEANPSERDGYAQAKLLQEEVVRRFASERGGRVTLLRLGAVYGPGHVWTSRLGAQLRPNLWLCVGRHAELPLSYVENCADAIVSAVERDAAASQTLHVVDDERPTQERFLRELLRRMESRPRVVRVPWPWVRHAASVAWACHGALGGRLRFPGILVPARLAARFKPLRYDNARAKRVLGWTPRLGLSAALDCSCPRTPLDAGAAAEES